MEQTQEKKKLGDFAFYFLMGILGISVLYIIGYLVYDMIFG
ncbi:MAG: hypothetical protein WHS65_06500 [Melioribacteraceae bacterium]